MDNTLANAEALKAINTDCEVSVGDLRLLVGQYTTRGKKSKNEDSIGTKGPSNLRSSTKGVVTCVADGVSHATHAADASKYCSEKFTEYYFATEETWSTERSIQNAIKNTNADLLNFSNQADTEKLISNQWLTTFCGVVFNSASAHIFNIGDSQVSRVRNSKYEVLTRHHSQKIGGKTNLLTRAMGADKFVSVDFQTIDLQVGDLFILSTDGFHDFVSPLATQQIVSEADSLSRTAIKLAQEALVEKSNDNISCLLVRVEQAPSKNQLELFDLVKNKKIPPALSVGMKLDGFLIKQVIHASSRSHLYLAEELKTRNLRVLKMPSKNFEEDLEYLQGFTRESWIGQNIKQPGVMKIFAPLDSSKFLYHVCEYVKGKTLREWIVDNPLPPIDKIRPIVDKLVEVMREFKKKDIVHRDLKPENIMIDDVGNIKIIDFGTVSIPSLEEQVNNISLNYPAGSLNYLAPESRYQLKSSHRSDQFSLGVLIYELLTGKVPFPEQGRFSSSQFRKSDWHYQSLLNIRDDIPFWIDLAIQKATDIDENFRYESYSELVMDLKAPNKELSENYLDKPLIERNPVRFWRGLSIIMTFLFVLSLVVRL